MSRHIIGECGGPELINLPVGARVILTRPLPRWFVWNAKRSKDQAAPWWKRITG